MPAPPGVDSPTGGEAELVRRRHTLATLERLLTAGLPAVEVRLMREGARRVVVARDVAALPGDLARVTGSCMARPMPCPPKSSGIPYPASRPARATA